MGKYTCHICGHSGTFQVYIASEMMQGLGGNFEYVLCENCGCLQIAETPTDLPRYYQKNYYAYSDISQIKTLVKAHWANYCMCRRDWIGFLVYLAKRTNPLASWITRVGLSAASTVLDVGCGRGEYLLQLQAIGFHNLVGIEPFLDNDIHYANGVKILRRSLTEMLGAFDFIMLNHSFEHMPNPLEALQNVYRLLKPKRFALVRIPLVSSYSWRTYGINWVQLDAPRHLFLHSEKSMRIVADEAMFKVADVVYDSTEFQFLLSEGYLKGLHFDAARKQKFSKKQIETYKSLATELNRQNDGDSACFYLYKEG